MHLTEQELDTIRQFFSTRPVLRAYLFGSYSRGEADAESDIDLLVSLDNSQPIGWEFFGWPEDLTALLAKKVDVVAPNNKPSRFKEEIAPDLQLIYERAA